MSHLVKKSGHNFSLACDHAASLRLLAGLPFSCFVFLCHHAFMFRANQPSPGNTPLYILQQQQQQHPPTSTFFKTPFAATLVRNLRHTFFFSSHALGLDPQYATLRHYPSPLVIPFMDGSDSLVCYLILTSHVHFFMQSHLGKPRLDPSPLAN